MPKYYPLSILFEFERNMNFETLLLGVKISYLFKFFFNRLIDFPSILAGGIHEMRYSAIYDVIYDVLRDVKHDIIYDVLNYSVTNDVIYDVIHSSHL